MDEQENNDRQNRRDRQAMDDHILTTLDGVDMRAEDFGRVFIRVRSEFYRGNITEGSLQRIAIIGRACLKVGIPLRLLEYTLLMELVRVPGGTARKYARRITRVIYDMKTEMVLRPQHDVATAHHNQQDEKPVPDADNSPPAVVDSELFERHMARVSQSWMGPDPLIPLVEAYSPLQGVTHIPFNNGLRPFPTYLLAMGVVIRRNQPDRLVAFDRAAMLAQIPRSLPPRLQTAVRGQLERMNTRATPSSQSAFTHILRVSKTKDKVKVGHLVAALCFLHYHIHNEGRNAFLYRQLKVMGLREVIDHSFPWGDRIQGTRVVDAKGRQLRIEV